MIILKLKYGVGNVQMLIGKRQIKNIVIKWFFDLRDMWY